jgi:outer membrane protein assembly factor BamB
LNRSLCCIAVAALSLAATVVRGEDQKKVDPTAEALAYISTMKVGKLDWPMWAGTPARNNTPSGTNIPTEWSIETGKNIKWRAELGSQTYGNPTVANGKVYVGTNNGHGYIKRYPEKVDLGCLLCFDEATGKFLWQHSSEKLPTGRVHDWPEQGICCAPIVDGDHLWYVTSRGTIVCLDVNGFQDGKNNGPFTKEPNENKDEADLVWEVDMMKEMAVSQHNMCSCSVCCIGDILFVNTSNGVDEGHRNIPSPKAPSFLAMDRNTGKVLWKDNSPGENILHGQWSSPAAGKLGGVMQVIFGAGDGWIYSFDVMGEDGKAKLLWKFDANPKKSLYVLGGRATRNHIIATPTIYDGKVYVAVGEDPEHGEGEGHLWCIDPTKRGDVSPELVYNQSDLSNPIPHKRLQAQVPEEGDVAKPNPNSAMVWHYGAGYTDKDFGKKKDEEGDKPEMHRTMGSATIKNDLLYIVDFSGYIHCLDAKTGALHWTEDMLAASWGSPMIVEDKVYIGNEEGDVYIFALSKEKKQIAKVKCGSSVYTSPVVANNTLFIANRKDLFAIQNGAQTDPAKLKGAK